MAQVYPLDITREIERRWDRRSGAALPRVARNDNQAGGLCPMCRGFAAIGPLGLEYRGKGLVHHHWLCRACAHEWVTVVHVLA